AGGGDITAAADQRLQDFVAPNRNEHEADRGRPGLHLRAARRSELPHRIAARPSHRRAAEEEIHLLRDHQNADEAAGHHAVTAARAGERSGDLWREAGRAPSTRSVWSVPPAAIHAITGRTRRGRSPSTATQRTSAA